MKKLIKMLVPSALKKKYRAYSQRNKPSGVHCPICDSKFQKFAPYGRPERENAKCHNCGSLERHRLIYLYLSEKLRMFPHQDSSKLKVLHFAPEEIFYNLFDNNPNIAYTPCDLQPEIYVYKGNTKIQKADITQIPFDADSFDFILCNHVLEHIEDDHKAMSELQRVLHKKGAAILQVPIDYKRSETYEDWSITDPKAREKAFGQHDHVRWYGQDYGRRLEAAGFVVRADPFVKDLDQKTRHKYGLMPSELIYHCTK